MPRIKHILCPVDLSEHSEFALTYAALLAGKLDARITTLYAYQLAPAPYPEDTLAVLRRVEGLVRETRSRELREMADRCGHGGVRIDCALEEGNPHQVILERAKALGVDLIVMGTHGRTGLPRALLGSVAERVVRTASVPVLTVHKPGTPQTSADARP